MNNGNTDNDNKNNTNNVRAVSEFRKETTDREMINKYNIAIEGLYEAYWECRHNKGRTHSASAFEADYEANLLELHREICSGDYEPLRSLAFIVTKPVKREIFAANFRDRIVHHWITIRIEPILEAEFIDETFNCRKGKGNSAGIEYLQGAIRECSENYTSDCWVMKLDLRSFFMSINRQRLYDKLQVFVEARYHEGDKAALLYLLERIIMNAPERNCIRKGHASDWDSLPPGKSLFTVPEGYGLPIGNLTSQLTANFLLNDTDHYIREVLGLRMARYVDDYAIVAQNKAELLAVVPKIREHLQQTAGVTLHPRKFYLQHCAKGVSFIGAVIKGERIYISNRTVSNARKCIHRFNALALAPGYVEKNAERFAASINSYLGIMSHYRTFNIRRKLAASIAPEWLRAIDIGPDYRKVLVKARYKRRNRIEHIVRKQRKNKKHNKRNEKQMHQLRG